MRIVYIGIPRQELQCIDLSTANLAKQTYVKILLSDELVFPKAHARHFFYYTSFSHRIHDITHF